MQLKKAPFKFLIVLFAAASSFINADAADRFYSIQLKKGSKIWLIGSAGPVEFSCDIGSFISNGIIPWPEENGIPESKHGQVKLDVVMPVSRVDCGNNMMNHDLRKALKSKEHPQIAFELLSHKLIEPSKSEIAGQPFSIETTGNLTISGVTRIERIVANGQVMENGQFRIRGTIKIDMTQFGITPPMGLFGMVKVNRFLSVHFDVIAALQEEVASPKS